MQYNIDYINIHYALIKAFMFNADKNILDISYCRSTSKIEIQIVLLKGQFLSEQFKEMVNESLSEFDISIKEIYLTKEQFNENRGEWDPKYYNWLEDVLFSKAEIL